MATTKTQIQTGSAVIAYCLEIEGYPYVLTTWGHDTAAVVTAYSSTDWSQVLGGLRVGGPYSQAIKPLDPEVDAGSISFLVDMGADDTFGKDVFSSQKSTGAVTDLTTSADPNDTTLHVRDNADFSSTGTVYIGTEAIAYTGRVIGGDDQFTGCTRGKYSPFAIDGGTRFGRHHQISQTAGAATFFPVVTDYKRVWIGSTVGLRVFRVMGGVLDARSESHLLFAGVISDIQDTEAGNTQVVAVDIRKRLTNAVLMSDQYSAPPEEGIALGDSDFIKLVEHGFDGAPTTTTHNSDIFDSSDLGTGITTTDELVASINSAINGSGSLTADWTIGKDGEGFVAISASLSGTSFWSFEIRVVMSEAVASLLGFDVAGAPSKWVDGKLGYKFVSDTSSGDPVSVSMQGTQASAIAAVTLYTGRTLTLAGGTGIFLNQGDQIPEPIKSRYETDDGSDWGFLRFRGFTLLAKKGAGDSFTTYFDDDVYRLFGQTAESVALSPEDRVIRAGSPVPRFTQVLLFEEKFSDIVPRLFASTGVSGYNEATYDDYDRQLGAAIPWELLGDPFVASVRDVAEYGETVLTILLDKPIRLIEILAPELALRGAHLVFKEGLRFARPKLSFNTADHTLTDSTMADDPDRADGLRPTVMLSGEHIINVLKVEYNRSFSGEFKNDIEIRNDTSVTEHGEREPRTIKARNTMLIGKHADASVIYDLVSKLAGDMLAIYDEPLTIVDIAVSGDVLIDIAPGDSVSLSSSFVRYNGDGARSVTNVAGYVLSTEFDLNAMRGQVTLALTGADLARASVFSPAAKIDETYSSGGFTAGYDSGGPSIRLKANEFSLSSEADDITHLDVGDAIRVIEKSPSSPGSPQSWTVDIDAKDEGNQQLDLSATLAGFDTSKEYYVISDDYAAAGSTQQTDCYIADDGDDKINNDERSRTFRDNSPSFEMQAADGSTDVLHEYPPTDGQWWSENKPLHPAVMQTLVKSVNNLISHRTATQCPLWLESSVAETSTSEKAMLGPFFFPVVSGFHRGRTLVVGPRIAVNIVSTGTVTVYSSRTPPRASDGASAMEDVTFPPGFARSVSFSTTSTTPANSTAKSLALVPNAAQTGTWITVLGKNATSNQTVLYGFHTWYLGAVT